jgi:hypothetical protein
VPTPSPVSAQVTALVTVNERLESLATEMTDAAGATSPDVGVIANAMSRTLVAIDAATQAVERLPADLAPIGAQLQAEYDRIAAICEDTLARRRTATDAYVAGAKSVAEAVARLAPITARLRGSP